MHMRNNLWLKKLAKKVWRKHFSDVAPANDLRVKFGRFAKWQLGAIRQSQKGKNNPSLITINGYFKNPVVPQYVIEAILAHEFIHYISGFSSSKPKLCKYPHRGGIIKNEMKRRGLSEIEKKQKEWIKKKWQIIIKL